MNYDDFQLGNFALYRFGSPKPNFYKDSRSTAVPDMTPEQKKRTKMCVILFAWKFIQNCQIEH